jgi:hypothetical protein
MRRRRPDARRWSRLAWFAGLYLVSLAAFAGVVYSLRVLLPR